MRCRECVALFVGLVGFSVSAVAQVVPPSDLPGRERSRFTDPPPPLSRPAGPLVQLPAAAAPGAAAHIKLKLRRIVIEGATVYGAKDFEPLYNILLGREISAADVYAVAAQIVSKYGSAGYPLVRAVVIPQAVSKSGATIRLRVVEGYIERVEWPEAAKRYRDLFSECIAKLTAERPARAKTIERCLLLASDLPGLRFTSTLKAGKNPDGGTVLVVSLTEKPFDALARIDNRGTPGRGPWQYLASVTENNRLGWHESLNFTYAAAFDNSELQYFSGTYHQAITTDGLAFDLNAYSSKGTPQLPSLTALNFRGNSEGVEGGFTYPVIRSREQNLFVSALGFAEHAFSDVLNAPNTNDQLRGVRLRANYDQVDTWLGTVGQTQIIGTFSQGINGLGSSANGNPLASIANGRVDFSKFELLASRTQAIAFGFSLYGAAFAQWAGSALLVPEQCGYGGRFFGRAFDPFEFAGDRCWETLGELRYDLPIPNALTSAQLYAFADHGDVTRIDPVASTIPHFAGSSAGGGIRLAWRGSPATLYDNLHLDLQAAKPVEGRANDAWRYFLIFTARY
jgi:hemolysin activation/secretion protein